MHHYKTDAETGLFLVCFNGATTLNDLSEGVALCIEANPARIATVWDLTNMLVAFELAEVTQLMEYISRLEFAGGRIAFITGVSEFSKTLVNLSDKMRPNKRLEWRHFPEKADAFMWAKSKCADV